MLVTAYIGIGANLVDPASQVHAGVAALAKLPSTRVSACSPFYRTAPVGLAAQPDFVNAVCVIETALSADALMQGLLNIECEHGRVRTTDRNAPRTLDLDLLLYGSHVSSTPTLTLPHPRMHERAFVLAPLADVAPELVVPGQGPVMTLLRRCLSQRVERMEN